MRLLGRLRSAWGNLVQRRRVEVALDEELRAYVDLLAQENRAKGMSAEEAQRAALIATGGIEQVKEEARDAWAGNAWATLLRESRHALRSLGRSPGFVAIAVSTLAIGIADATAVFSVVDALLLRPLPAVSDPGRLVVLERSHPTTGFREFSYPDYVDIRDHATTLAGVAAYNGTSFMIEDRAGRTRAWVSYVSGNFFSVLGATPALGRAFGPADATSLGANRVVVLGHDLWQRRFGSDSSVVGATLKINGDVFTVIGVAPAGFIGAMKLHHMELFIPLTMVATLAHQFSDSMLEERDLSWLGVVGRLRPGASPNTAQRELDVIAARLARAYPADKGYGVRVEGEAGMWHDERVEVSRLPFLLSIAVMLLLLIACANVATLCLVRTTAKRRELATRLALGASRASLVRHFAIEGCVLAAASAAVGALLALGLLRSAAIVTTIGRVAAADVHVDWDVLAVGVGLTAITAIIVSVLPAVQASRTNASLLIKDGSGGALLRTRGQATLVVLQVAASLVLLAAAGMVFSSLQRALRTNLGFEARGLTETFIEAAQSGIGPEQTARFYAALLERGSSDPTFAGVALAADLPPAPWANRGWVFRNGEAPATRPYSPSDVQRGFPAYNDVVSANFFDVMRIPIELGRRFDARDVDGRPAVAIVSRRLADAMWPGQNPVGQYVAWTAKDPLLVVGVAGNTQHVSLTGGPAPAIYLPLAQNGDYRPNLELVARGHGDVPVPTTELRKLVAAVDARVTANGGSDLVDAISSQMQPQRLASSWIAAFGAIALLLAALGLYGVVAQSVLQRTRELAVRAALGATPRALKAMVVAKGMRLAAAGVLLGGVGALFAVRILRSMVSEVEAVDSAATVAAVVVLASVMFAASYVPARRAARLNPVDALRCD